MNLTRAVTTTAIVVVYSTALSSSFAAGAELRDVLKHPRKYEGQHVELIGIARTYQGWFNLFADASSAARPDLSRALLVRRNYFGGYAQLDRQWVRVSGVMSSQRRRGYDPGTGLLLEHAEIVWDRTPPHIKNPYVLGVFYNATGKPVAIDQSFGRNRGAEEFFLAPDEADKTEIFEGDVVIAAELVGPANLRLHQRQVGRPVAKGELKFRHLLAVDYEYSPEWSDKRTFYYKVTLGKIERVPTATGKKWKIVGSKATPRYNQTMKRIAAGVETRFYTTETFSAIPPSLSAAIRLSLSR